MNTRRLVMMSIFIAVGVVITQFLRFEGFAPMAHFWNVIMAVIAGPTVAFFCAVMIGLLRMVLLGIPPLALTGAVFGALLAGLLYRLSGRKLIFAGIGEIIGTGIIGSMLSYPVMTFFMGKGGLGWFYYTPSFLTATVAGSTLGYVFLKILSANGMLDKVCKFWTED